jgi:chromosome segregation protein
MFLKALTIKGFKSFADATTLEMEPGVTVVVGPNGSGKSNVVDAIGWVLGAQAPSSVRSQKMDDVIFAGSSNRPALGRAEVALTIDNSAGLLPIEFAEVTLARTLFREGDSEYSINGVPCRLLDVQELLSDTGVGRQQHVIISQGQIDAVLNARAEDRRLIIEEAAGVLKYRRRKEKAERRLAATEGNLTRLHDLLREVRRQLRPLERQADAARRHGSLVEELTNLRIYVAGLELTRLRARLEQQAGSRRDLAEQDRTMRAKLASLDADVLSAESRLSALGGDDISDDLVRSEALRERARGIATLLAERSRGIAREREALVDQALIASLEAEAAELTSELAGVDAESEQVTPELDRIAALEASVEEERARFQETWGDAEPVVASGKAAEVRGELGVLQKGVERGTAEAERMAARLAAAESKASGLADEADRLRTDIRGLEEAAPRVGDAEQQAAAALAAAEQRVVRAGEIRRSAEADQHAWAARAEALSLALDEARDRAGAQRLASVAGVLGPLVDQVEVDEGWEAAFEAIAGDALATVLVTDPDAGQRALEALREADASGAVLVLPPAATSFLPADGLRAHVRAADPAVNRLLDRLLARVELVDSWAEGVAAARRDPERRYVTKAGDHFGPNGWRIGTRSAVVTAAALEEAQRRAEETASLAARAAQDLAAAEAAVDAARRAETRATREVHDTAAKLTATRDALARVEAERTEVASELEVIAVDAAELDERVNRDRNRAGSLQQVLPGLEAEEQAIAERTRARAEARDQLERRSGEAADARRDIEVATSRLRERRMLLERRQAEIEERLARHEGDREGAEARRLEVERRERATVGLATIVDQRLHEVEAVVIDLRERRRRQSEATRAVVAQLDGLRQERAAAEQQLGEIRERQQRSELDEAETKLRTETAVEALRRDLEVEPEVAMDAPAPDLPDGTTPVARVRELERELRLMGPINPLALEEYEALQERHTFLEGQLEDVKQSRRELAKVIKAVDGEIVSVFAAAFADVSNNFTQLFETLFPGGAGRLRLTSPDDLLETGIELEAKPSGKNVKKLSLLSGGERSLTALAYLFAVFRARPSPFYVMDEVEAALDDVNLHRFLDLVHEFRREAQLVIVSHQKRTMEAADCLYGVTMEPGGSSKVLSEKVTVDIR